VLDLARFAALLLALVRSARARFALGLGGALVALYVLVAAAANAFVGRAEGGPALLAFGAVFLGPTSVHGAGRAPLPLAASLDAHPWLAPALILIVSVLAARAASRRAAALRPESETARRLDGVASPLVFVAVVEAIVLVAAAMVRVLLANAV
jgi:hypothetical protein